MVRLPFLGEKPLWTKSEALCSLIISHAERMWQENVIGLIRTLASVTKENAVFEMRVPWIA